VLRSASEYEVFKPGISGLWAGDRTALVHRKFRASCASRLDRQAAEEIRMRSEKARRRSAYGRLSALHWLSLIGIPCKWGPSCELNGNKVLEIESVQ
jgi:hypothetical protein